MIENIQNTQIERTKLARVPTRPNSAGLYGSTAMTSPQLKERMDALALLAVNKVNELINYLKTSDFASDIKITEDISLSAFATKLLGDIGSGALSEYLMVKSGDESVTLLHKLAAIGTDLDTLDKDIRALEETSDQLLVTSEAISSRLDNISESIKSDIAAEIESALDELEEYANNLYGGEDNG